MHTISSLRKTLGLTSANQVRNRIEAIKDLLALHTRRGPNNQILLTDAGADLLRQLQELYDSGLTMTEASEVVRASSYKKDTSALSVLPGSPSNETKPDHSGRQLAALRDELAHLARRVASLEEALATRQATPTNAETSPSPWWSSLQEEIDAS